MAEDRPTVGAPEQAVRPQARGLRGYRDAREAARLGSVQAPLARAASDPATRSPVRAVGLLAGAVESVAAPPPGEV